MVTTGSLLCHPPTMNSMETQFKNPTEIGTWLSCNICYKKRLECFLATLTYRIPSIRNVSRTIRYCKDDEECVFQALARQRRP